MISSPTTQGRPLILSFTSLLDKKKAARTIAGSGGLFSVSGDRLCFDFLAEEADC